MPKTTKRKVKRKVLKRKVVRKVAKAAKKDDGAKALLEKAFSDAGINPKAGEIEKLVKTLSSVGQLAGVQIVKVAKPAEEPKVNPLKEAEEILHAAFANYVKTLATVKQVPEIVRWAQS